MSTSKYFVVLLSIALVLPSTSWAFNQRNVLGESTTSTNIDFPPVTDGPGFIMPDSPLYPVDKMFQKLKLAASFSPEQKVKTRMLIVGERVAEVRAMMVRENTEGTQRALDELRAESDNLAYDLRDASGQGKDVKDLAKDINDRLELHREFLSSVAEQSDDGLAHQLDAANDKILSAKITAEDYLPEDLMADAINTDLESEIDRDVLGVETSTIKLEKKFNKLDLQASKSAEKEQRKEIREEAKASRSALIDQRKKLVEARKAKLKKLQEERKAKLKEAKEAVQKAKDAAKRLREIRAEEKKTRGEDNTQVSPSVTPEAEHSQESEGSNTSGSNSGSGNSNRSSGSSR